MLFLGVHIGPFIIRISQLHTGRSSPRLEARRMSPYDTGRRRAPEYQGCLPNLCCNATGAVGYEALDHMLDGKSGKLDNTFFRKLMSGPNSAALMETWRALLGIIRDSYVDVDEQQEPMNVALYLEGISFRGSRSRLRFWESQPDETPQLEKKLTLAGQTEGLEGVRVVTGSRTVDGLNRMSDTFFCQGDLVCTIGAEKCEVWSVESKGPDGIKKVSESKEGWLAILSERQKKEESLRRRMLSALHNPYASRELPIPALDDWREKILSIVSDAYRMVEGPLSRLLIAGAGAYLVDRSKFPWPEFAVEYLPRPHFVHSHGAAALCYLEHDQGGNR